MIPYVIEKWRFAKKYYPNLKRDTARRRVMDDIHDSPAVMSRLEKVGYEKDSHMLRRVELLIIMEEWCLPDDFFDH